MERTKRDMYKTAMTAVPVFYRGKRVAPRGKYVALEQHVNDPLMGHFYNCRIPGYAFPVFIAENELKDFCL